MDVTYENLTRWFDSYFAAFNQNAGPLSSLEKMQNYFTSDLEFWPYNMPGGQKPLSREGLLMTMVHPGLHEHLTPREYVVDLKKMIVVAQFEVQFSDTPSGKVWPAKQASAQYYLVQDRNKDLKIKKIIYFMEQRPPEEGSYRDLWIKYREQALAGKAGK